MLLGGHKLIVEPVRTESGDDPRVCPFVLDETELPPVDALERPDGHSLDSRPVPLSPDRRDLAALFLIMGPNSS
jgi:hypothetical protein